MRPQLSDYKHLSAGKVRELYEIDDDTLLMVPPTASPPMTGS